MARHETKTDIPVELGDLTRQWEVLEQLYLHYDRLPDNPPGPDLVDRYLDEQQTAGHRAYINAGTHISNAREHNELLRHLLTERGPGPTTPWTLMRSVFESGFWATWLLEPDDGLERRKRGLRLDVLNHKQRVAYFNDYLAVHPVERAKVQSELLVHNKTYQAEAAALKMDWSLAGQRIDLTQELPKLETVKDLGEDLRGQAVATWRVLSGSQHGHSYAMMQSSDFGQKSGILGGHKAFVTINDDALQAAGSMAHIMHRAAVSLFVQRSVNSSL